MLDGKDGDLGFVLDQLELLKSKRIARQHRFFLRDFDFRFKKNFDLAESEFLSAHKLASKKFSINREFATLYLHQGDFVEAESYARAAYDVAPTNPYLPDVLLDILGSSFYQLRLAHDFFSTKRLSQSDQRGE